VVQAAQKLVLEPIFEVEFRPCSSGFRPKRRAQDAIAEIHFLASAPRNYEWVLEADIEACFDCIDHTALMDRVLRRIGDRRVLALVKAFLKAGILGEDMVERDTSTGIPQGRLCSAEHQPPDEQRRVMCSAGRYGLVTADRIGPDGTGPVMAEGPDVNTGVDSLVEERSPK
jgi:RNA-directed DNA polymerase